jgi:U2-associated protein SR140
MQSITNLYVGNLDPEVTEEMLVKAFCRYGEVESVKIMWPRTEEERKRKRNCGFVKYFKYEAAYLAKEALNEKMLLGNSMRINWGKGISNLLRQ